MEKNDKIEYIGCKEEQQVWGGPYGDHSKLVVGNIYTINKIKIHEQHTKIFLKEFPEECFNSVCFKE